MTERMLLRRIEELETLLAALKKNCAALDRRVHQLEKSKTFQVTDARSPYDLSRR